MKGKKRVKKLPGNPVGVGSEVYKIYCNGKLADSITLNAEHPQMVFYAENDAATDELYQGLSDDEAKALYFERATRYIVNVGYSHLAELYRIAPDAAERVFSDMMENMLPSEDGKPEYNIRYI